MLPSFSLKNLHADWSNSIYDFGLPVNNHYNHVSTWLIFLFSRSLKMAESSINSNHWIYESNDFFELLLQQKLSFIRVSTLIIWRAFWRASWNFSAFQTSLNNVFVRFFCLIFFKWNSTLAWPDVLNTGFTIIKFILFCAGQHLTRWRCLLSRGTFCLADVRKHFSYWGPLILH